VSEETALIPPGARVEGRIECSGDLVLRGHLKGHVQIGGHFIIAGGAVCHASCRANSAVIHGDLVGNIVCSESIIVAVGARIVGDLLAPDIQLASDAEIDGTIDRLPPNPAVVPMMRTPMRLRGGAFHRPMPPLLPARTTDRQ